MTSGPSLLALIVTVSAAAACGGKGAPPAKPVANASAATAPAAAPVARDFAAEAAAAGFMYVAPEGYTPTPVVDNMDVSYDHAVRSADGRVELRYALRPYPRDLPPDLRNGRFSSTFFLTAIMNITRGGATGEASEAQPMPHEPFGADEGTMTIVRWPSADGPADAFARGFVAGVVLYLHREDLGDAYLFVLLKTEDAASALREPDYHSLRFAPR